MEISTAWIIIMGFVIFTAALGFVLNKFMLKMSGFAYLLLAIVCVFSGIFAFTSFMVGSCQYPCEIREVTETTVITKSTYGCILIESPNGMITTYDTRFYIANPTNIFIKIEYGKNIFGLERKNKQYAVIKDTVNE